MHSQHCLLAQYTDLWDIPTLFGVEKAEIILNVCFRNIAFNAKPSRDNYQKDTFCCCYQKLFERMPGEIRQPEGRMCWVSKDWRGTKSFLCLKTATQSNLGNNDGSFCFGPCNDIGTSEGEDYQPFRDVIHLSRGQLSQVPCMYMKHHKTNWISDFHSVPNKDRRDQLAVFQP